MRHLHACLAETSGKHWLRIHSSLRLVEALEAGCIKALTTETPEWRPADLVHRLSLLENFENNDKYACVRVNSIRRMAGALRHKLAPRVKTFDVDLLKDIDDCKDTMSTCSPRDSESSEDSSMCGADDRTLAADLKRITHSGLLEAPEEPLAAVLRASANEADRLAIAEHLQRCLEEPKSKHWRRIHGGLLLAEALMKRNAWVLTSPEALNGRHQDLVLRLRALENFENNDTKVAVRVNSIRKMAQALRCNIVSNLSGRCVDKRASACAPEALDYSDSICSNETTIASI
jgi:hypothetical protein